MLTFLTKIAYLPLAIFGFVSMYINFMADGSASQFSIDYR